MHTAFFRWTCLLFFIAALAPASLAASIEESFEVQIGTMPIILTAPHGGHEHPPGLTVRTTKFSGFHTVTDTHTSELTRHLADEIERLTGQKPYVVICRVEREYVDLNRDKAAHGGIGAFETPDAEPYYDHYHDAVRHAVDQVNEQFGQGLLLDIHGQSFKRDTIFRGTRNGESVTRMLEKHGAAALTGPHSIFGQLEAMGYPVAPDNLPLDQAPEVKFVGLYTMTAYGSHQPDGIDAIQIEIGRDHRIKKNNSPILKKTATDLATAVQAYYTTYLTE